MCRRTSVPVRLALPQNYWLSAFRVRDVGYTYGLTSKQAGFWTLALRSEPRPRQESVFGVAIAECWVLGLLSGAPAFEDQCGVE